MNRILLENMNFEVPNDGVKYLKFYQYNIVINIILQLLLVYYLCNVLNIIRKFKFSFEFTFFFCFNSVFLGTVLFYKKNLNELFIVIHLKLG